MARKRRVKPDIRPHAKRADAAPAAFVGPGPWSRQDRLWLGGGLLCAFAVYVSTMWPSMAGGDAGELTAVAYTLGTVHPPGYPLFTMLAHLFTYLPVGTVAWRVNFFSVICSLTALALLFSTTRRITKSAVTAFTATMLLAFSPLYWRYSILAEVFPLNNVILTALLYLWVRFLQERELRLIYLMAFLFGLGMSNHHTIMFVGIPVGFSLLIQERARLLKPLPLLKVFGLFFIGLLPYAYLFWASARAPLVAWGDITSWDGFMTHLMRKEYGTFQLATEGSKKNQLFFGLWYYLLSLAEHTLYVGTLAVAAGIYVITRLRERLPRPLAYGLVILPIFYLIVFHNLANLPFVEGAALYKDIVARFWIMPHIFFAIVFAIGLQYLGERFPLNQKGWPIALAILLPLVNLALNVRAEDHHDNYVFTEFGKHLLEPLPPNATFFTLGDINTNAVRYLQSCENYRTDVTVLDRSLMSYPWMKRIAAKHFPDLVLPGVAYHPSQKGFYDFKRLFETNFAKRQIYMTMIKTKDSNEAFDKAWESSYSLLPYGLSFKVVPIEQPFQIDQYLTDSAKFLVDPTQVLKKPPLPDSWDAVILANYWLAHHVRAAEILRYALKTQDKAYFETAEKLLEDLIARNPNPPADYFKNAGISQQHLMKFSQGEDLKRHERRMLEVWEIYIQKTDRRDKTYDNIRSILKAYGRLAQ